MQINIQLFCFRLVIVLLSRNINTILKLIRFNHNNEVAWQHSILNECKSQNNHLISASHSSTSIHNYYYSREKTLCSAKYVGWHIVFTRCYKMWRKFIDINVNGIGSRQPRQTVYVHYRTQKSFWVLNCNPSSSQHHHFWSLAHAHIQLLIYNKFY